MCVCSKSGKAFTKRVGKIFDSLVDDYLFDEVNNVLIPSPKKKDIQAYIDSFKDCALDRILDKFIVDDNIDDTVVDYVDSNLDLSLYGDVIDKAEYYREKFGNPVYKDGALKGQAYSVADIYKLVGENAEQLKLKLINGEKKDEKEKENIEEKE